MAAIPVAKEVKDIDILTRERERTRKCHKLLKETPLVPSDYLPALAAIIRENILNMGQNIYGIVLVAYMVVDHHCTNDDFSEILELPVLKRFIMPHLRVDTVTYLNQDGTEETTKAYTHINSPALTPENVYSYTGDFPSKNDTKVWSQVCQEVDIMMPKEILNTEIPLLLGLDMYDRIKPLLSLTLNLPNGKFHMFVSVGNPVTVSEHKDGIIPADDLDGLILELKAKGRQKHREILLNLLLVASNVIDYYVVPENFIVPELPKMPIFAKLVIPHLRVDRTSYNSQNKVYVSKKSPITPDILPINERYVYAGLEFHDVLDLRGCILNYTFGPNVTFVVKCEKELYPRMADVHGKIHAILKMLKLPSKCQAEIF